MEREKRRMLSSLPLLETSKQHKEKNGDGNEPVLERLEKLGLISIYLGKQYFKAGRISPDH